MIITLQTLTVIFSVYLCYLSSVSLFAIETDNPLGVYIKKDMITSNLLVSYIGGAVTGVSAIIGVLMFGPYLPDELFTVFLLLSFFAVASLVRMNEAVLMAEGVTFKYFFKPIRKVPFQPFVKFDPEENPEVRFKAEYDENYFNHMVRHHGKD